MEKPISKACPLTHHRWGGNEEIPQDECQIVLEVMPEVQAKLDQGLVLLIEIAEPQGSDPEDKEVLEVDSSKADRTGRMAFVSPAMVTQMFGEGNDEVKTAFINKEIMDGLEMMAAKLEEHNAKQMSGTNIQTPGDVATSVEFEELPNESE